MFRTGVRQPGTGFSPLGHWKGDVLGVVMGYPFKVLPSNRLRCIDRTELLLECLAPVFRHNERA